MKKLSISSFFMVFFLAAPLGTEESVHTTINVSTSSLSRIIWPEEDISQEGMDFGFGTYMDREFVPYGKIKGVLKSGCIIVDGPSGREELVYTKHFSYLLEGKEYNLPAQEFSPLIGSDLMTRKTDIPRVIMGTEYARPEEKIVEFNGPLGSISHLAPNAFTCTWFPSKFTTNGMAKISIASQYGKWANSNYGRRYIAAIFSLPTKSLALGELTEGAKDLSILLYSRSTVFTFTETVCSYRDSKLKKLDLIKDVRFSDPDGVVFSLANGRKIKIPNDIFSPFKGDSISADTLGLVDAMLYLNNDLLSPQGDGETYMGPMIALKNSDQSTEDDCSDVMFKIMSHYGGVYKISNLSTAWIKSDQDIQYLSQQIARLKKCKVFFQ